MNKLFLALVATATMATKMPAQNFSSFATSVPELQLNNEVKLDTEADAIRYPISHADSRYILQEADGEHYAIGKVTLSKATIIVYYTKPPGTAPLGKITAVSFSASGKRIASEAIGVFADFAGMHFTTGFTASTQPKGAATISSHVTALKDNGEINPDMSKITVYHFSAKGKITRM